MDKICGLLEIAIHLEYSVHEFLGVLSPLRWSKTQAKREVVNCVKEMGSCDACQLCEEILWEELSFALVGMESLRHTCLNLLVHFSK